MVIGIYRNGSFYILGNGSDYEYDIGWHTYKKSNQLWHVGGVGTFRSSIIVNKKKKCGDVILRNALGKKGANLHYLAKMIYSELKINKIDLNKKDSIIGF